MSTPAPSPKPKKRRRSRMRRKLADRLQVRCERFANAIEACVRGTRHPEFWRLLAEKIRDAALVEAEV